MKVDNDTLAVMKVQQEMYSGRVSERFHSVFVAPGAARKVFQYMPRFVAVDGTFTKNRFIQILLLAAGIDANDQLVILAWAVAPNESQETRTWFLGHLLQAFPLLNQQELVIINDREKGLLNAIQKVVPTAFNAYCCCHIASNVQAKFGLAAKKYIPVWLYLHSKLLTVFLGYFGKLHMPTPKAHLTLALLNFLL